METDFKNKLVIQGLIEGVLNQDTYKAPEDYDTISMDSPPLGSIVWYWYDGFITALKKEEKYYFLIGMMDGYGYDVPQEDHEAFTEGKGYALLDPDRELDILKAYIEYKNNKDEYKEIRNRI